MVVEKKFKERKFNSGVLVRDHTVMSEDAPAVVPPPADGGGAAAATAADVEIPGR